MEKLTYKSGLFFLCYVISDLRFSSIYDAIKYKQRILFNINNLIENYGGIMSNSYSSDSPVHVVEEDKFSRWQFSKRIADVIANRNDPSSIVIGLYGAWGNGKTSVLNFIENALSNNGDVITIKFNPWRFGAEEELLKSFFFDVANAIDTQLVTNGDKVKGAVKAIAPAITGLFGSSEVGQAISGFIPTVELEKLKERIESALETTKKRVLILIDDVDRLEKTEIHALFRLVKLTADFKYTAYILAFDKDIVASSLQERYSNLTNNAGEAFLEKIIQVPLYLPLIDQSILINYCFQGVDQALNMAEIELTQDQASNFARLFTRYFGHSLSTPRKAKLYGNILLFSLPILKGEVNVVELMLIEAIRVFYPPVYELLRTNKDAFVGTFSQSRYSNNDHEKEKLKNALENAIDLCKGASKENIISLLKELFPKVISSYQNTIYGSEWYSIWDKEQKVCAPNYYSRYFTYSINSSDVSDTKLEEVLKECEHWVNLREDKNPLNEVLCDTNAEKLIQKLRVMAEGLANNISLSLCIAIAQKAKDLPYRLQLFDWFTPLIQGAMLINELVQNFEKGDRLDQIKLILDHSSSLDFILDIYNWLKKYDPEKPEEINCLAESEVNALAIYIVDIFKNRILLNEDIIKGASRNLPNLFSILNKYENPNFLTDYLVKELPIHPENIILIICSYLGIAEGGNRKVPHRSDLKYDQYKWIIEQIDEKVLIDFIESTFDAEELLSDDFPEQDDNLDDGEFVFIKQFYWFYKNPKDEELKENIT